MNRRRSSFALALGVMGLVVTPHQALAYLEGGHFYSIGNILYPVSGAEAMVLCTELPDEVRELGAVPVASAHWFDVMLWVGMGWGNREPLGRVFLIHQLLHSLNDSNADEFLAAAVETVAELKRRADVDGSLVNRCAVGFGLHMLGDAFAHRYRKGDVEWMFPPGQGHAAKGILPDMVMYEPDRPHLWREKNWERYLDVISRIFGRAFDPALLSKLQVLAGKHGWTLQAAQESEAGFTELLRQHMPLKDARGQPLSPSHTDDNKACDPHLRKRLNNSSITCGDVWRAYLNVARQTLGRFNTTGVPLHAGSDLP